jgi:guanylate kinase
MTKTSSLAKTVNSQKPLLVVLSGFSGTGKSTIVNELLKRDRRFAVSVSATTRPKRVGEKEGRDYYFLEPNAFRNKMSRNEFIETAKLFGEWYGTPKKGVLEALRRKRVVLFDIDVLGGMSVKKWRSDAVLIFVLPPSLRELRKRLARRKTESAAAMKLRLARVLKEISFWSKYDYVVCNKDLTETVDLVMDIIRAESQNTSRCKAITIG